MARAKAVFIDWNGTLSNSYFWQEWHDDPNSEVYKILYRHLFAGSSDILDNWMLGKLTAEQAINLIADKEDLLVEVCLDELRCSCEMMKIADGALELVRQNREAGRLVFIATDNMDTFTRWTVPAQKLEQEFDGILNSTELGAFKKHIAPDGSSLFFQDTFKKFDLKPEEAILIDDSEDSRVVERFGMKFQKINSPTEAINALKGLL